MELDDIPFGASTGVELDDIPLGSGIDLDSIPMGKSAEKQDFDAAWGFGSPSKPAADPMAGSPYEEAQARKRSGLPTVTGISQSPDHTTAEAVLGAFQGIEAGLPLGDSRSPIARNPNSNVPGATVARLAGGVTRGGLSFWAGGPVAVAADKAAQIAYEQGPEAFKKPSTYGSVAMAGATSYLPWKVGQGSMQSLMDDAGNAVVAGGKFLAKNVTADLAAAEAQTRMDLYQQGIDVASPEGQEALKQARIMSGATSLGFNALGMRSGIKTQQQEAAMAAEKASLEASPAGLWYPDGSPRMTLADAQAVPGQIAEQSSNVLRDANATLANDKLWNEMSIAPTATVGADASTQGLAAHVDALAAEAQRLQSIDPTSQEVAAAWFKHGMAKQQLDAVNRPGVVAESESGPVPSTPVLAGGIPKGQDVPDLKIVDTDTPTPAMESIRLPEEPVPVPTVSDINPPEPPNFGPPREVRQLTDQTPEGIRRSELQADLRAAEEMGEPQIAAMIREELEALPVEKDVLINPVTGGAERAPREPYSLEVMPSPDHPAYINGEAIPPPVAATPALAGALKKKTEAPSVEDVVRRATADITPETTPPPQPEAIGLGKDGWKMLSEKTRANILLNLRNKANTEGDFAASVITPESVAQQLPWVSPKQASRMAEKYNSLLGLKGSDPVVSTTREGQGQEASIPLAPEPVVGDRTGYGTSNKLVTREAVEAARRAYLGKLGTSSNPFLDPEMVSYAAKVGAYHLEAGAREFAEWSVKMVADLGESVRPHLQQVWDSMAPAKAADAPAAGGTPAGKSKYTEPLNEKIFTKTPEEQAILQKVSEDNNNFDDYYTPTSEKALAEEVKRSKPLTEARIQEMVEKKGGVPSKVEVTQLASLFRTALLKVKADPSPENVATLAKFGGPNKAVRSGKGADFALMKAQLDENAELVESFRKSGDYQAESLAYLANEYGDDPIPQKLAAKVANAKTREDAYLAIYEDSRKNHPFWNSWQVANLLLSPVGRIADATSTSASIIMHAIINNPMNPELWGTALAGAAKGMKTGVDEFKYTFKHGFSPEQAAAGPKAIAQAHGFALGGAKNPANWGSRTAHGGDQFFFSVAREMEASVAAAKAAKQAGLTSKDPEWSDFISDWKDANRDSEAITHKANAMIFRMIGGEPNTAGGTLDQKIRKLLQWQVGEGQYTSVRPLGLIVPFYSSVVNFTKQAVASTPVGGAAALAGALTRDSMGLKQRPDLAKRLVQSAVGSTALALVYDYAMNGGVTGNMPTDAAGREAFMGAKKQPNTIRIGGHQIPFAMLGPQVAGALMAVSAYADAVKKEKLSEKEVSVVEEAAVNFGKSVMGATPAAGVAGFMDVISGGASESRVNAWVANLLSSVAIPGVTLQGGANRVLDPVMRDTEDDTFMGELKKRMVGKTVAAPYVLPERIGEAGLALPRNKPFGTEDGGLKLYSELSKHGVKIPGVSASVPKDAQEEGVKTKDFSPEEMRLIRLSAQPEGKELEEFVRSQWYQSLSPEDQKYELELMIDSLDLSSIKSEAKWEQLDRRPLAGAI